MKATDDEPEPDRRAARADLLKERIYITFSALAVTLALQADVDHETAGAAARTLALGVIGTLLAVFVADVVAHIAVHAALPHRDELGHVGRVSLLSLPVLVIPLLLVALAGFHFIALSTALLGSTLVLVLSLVAIGYLAVRRLALPLHLRLAVLLAEACLGLLVVTIEMFAH